MRIYIPATVSDLGCEEISPRIVHAATPAQAQEVGDEEREYLEAVATNAAADDSLLRIMHAHDAGQKPVLRRLVIAADADESELVGVDSAAAEGLFFDGDTPADQLPSALAMINPASWKDVVSFHLDAFEAEANVRAAISGENDSSSAQAAFDRLGEEDLLWYDVSERLTVAVELGAAFFI